MSGAKHILSEYAFNVAAGDISNLGATGTHIRITDASEPFKLSIDHGKPVTLERGIGLTFPKTFFSVQVIAPEGSSVTGRIIVSDGVVFDNRVSISAEAGLSVNVIKTTGPQLKFYSNTALAAATGEQVQALDTNMEWALIENRGTTVLLVGIAAGTANALTLQPGEKLKLVTGGPIYITNTHGTDVGAYAVAYGWRA